LKVGFFSNIFWGEFGSAKLARNLVANMAKHKDVEEIKILTVEPSRGGLEKNLRNNNIYTVPISIKPPFDRYEFLLKSLTYDKFFRDVDIIHVEHSFEGILAQKCKNKYGIPFIFVREIVSKDLPSLYSKLFLFNLEKLLTLHLDYDILISPSRYMVDNYFVKWGIDPNKIRIIPAGIDTKFFRPKKNVKDIRLRYGIGKDSFVLFSIKIL
jgi:glycosyltransferase involved in cell wall biosynthesis